MVKADSCEEYLSLVMVVTVMVTETSLFATDEVWI